MKKEGPNKGRKFYVCPKPREQQCTFFEWADDESDPVNSSTYYNYLFNHLLVFNKLQCIFSATGPRKRVRKKTATVPKKKFVNTKSTTSRTKTTTKRKCSQCRQEGHTIKNCPNISHV